MSRKVLAAALALIAFYAGNVFGQDNFKDSVRLRFDSSLKQADGNPAYVDDAAVAAKIDSIKPFIPRISSCFQSMTIPESLSITYAPKTLTPHSVASNLVRCTHERDSADLVCDTHVLHPISYFDKDPAQSFVLEDVGMDEGVAVIRAVLDGLVEFNPDVQDPKLGAQKGLLGAISKTKDGYDISYGDCGCSGHMQITKDTTGKLVVTHAGYAMCI